MKVMTVLGTRPEAIKLAPVIKQLQQHAARNELESIVCVTGQHRQMLDQVLNLFGIAPDIDLNLMQESQTLAQLTARVLTTMEPVLSNERPDWIVVQGDTTTVMASALAAFYLRIRVAHVEAGLRTGDRANPFPEEVNRLVADDLSDWLFAPTQAARRNLLREGYPEPAICVTGNTVIDALNEIAQQPCPAEIETLVQPGVKLVLVTAHRRENFGRPLENICEAIAELARRHEDVRFVYPVHLNPNVRETAHKVLGGLPGVSLLPPVDYLALVGLMKHSYLILTDSGGIQEEAPSLGVPVLVLRENTERPEAVEAGVARIVGTDSARIIAEVERLLSDPAARASMAQSANPFGDGQAARRIVDTLITGQRHEYATGAST